MNDEFLDYPSPCDYGWIHEDDVPNLVHLEDMLDGIVEAVYLTGNVEQLENCLEEALYCFSKKLPKHAPLLENRQKIINLLTG